MVKGGPERLLIWGPLTVRLVRWWAGQVGPLGGADNVYSYKSTDSTNAPTVSTEHSLEALPSCLTILHMFRLCSIQSYPSFQNQEINCSLICFRLVRLQYIHQLIMSW